MPDRSYSLITVEGIPIGGVLQKPAASFANGAKPAWIGYIGVDDVDAYIKRLQESGGFVHRAAEDIPNVGRFAVVADPQGANFVLFQPPNAGQQPERPAPGTPGSPAWHDLAAIDWQSAFTFYADMFGWTKSDAMDMGPNGVYQIFACDGVPIGGMMTRMDPAQSPGWLYYFNVEEIGAALTRVTQHGGTVIHGPLRDSRRPANRTLSRLARRHLRHRWPKELIRMGTDLLWRGRFADMKNIFDTAAMDEVKTRLLRLRPESEQQWGTMTPAQTLAHCSAALEWAVGDRFPPRMLLGRIMGQLVKPMLLRNDEPMRRNAPTAKSLVVADERDLETERERLCGLIDRFAKAGPAGCTTNPHSFFGRLTPEEWAILMYKHLDHHLRQFGV